MHARSGFSRWKGTDDNFAVDACIEILHMRCSMLLEYSKSGNCTSSQRWWLYGHGSNAIKFPDSSNDDCTTSSQSDLPFQRTR